MKALALKEKYRSFREWQQQPHQVKPLTDEEHDCATCGTHFQGNYCPRCGQSATVGRYSFKKAFLLFLDVWGLGNRGMFRTLRDLLLRPGYMIRDYLGGMQMAYFPPFKMFFLLIAFSVLVEGGFNIRLENRLSQTKENMEKGFKIGSGKSVEEAVKEEKKMDGNERKILKYMTTTKDVANWISDHQTVVSLLWLIVFSLPLYLFFRRSPKIPDIRYSEFFVAMVYTSNMMTILTSICGILCLSVSTMMMGYILTLIPLKQLSGFSYKRTLFNVVAAFVLLFLAFLLLVGTVFGIIAVVNNW